MLTVTIKVAIQPGWDTSQLSWQLAWGPVTPFEGNEGLWHWSPDGLKWVETPIIVEMDEATRYIIVGLFTGWPPERIYRFETTTPFVFENKATYIWDTLANSLSKEVPPPPPEPPPPPPEKFLDTIISFVLSISGFFKGLYDNVPDLDWLTDWIKTPLLFIYETIFKLIKPIVIFRDWVDDVADKISKAFTWEAIKSAILTWLPGLEGAIAWFTDWWNNVLTRINDWWAATKSTVQGWIDIVKESLADMIATLNTALGGLMTAWNNFLSLTLPTLISAANASALIDSTLKRWFPNYDDLVKLWVDTKLFIATPLDWLLDKFTDWFLGKE